MQFAMPPRKNSHPSLNVRPPMLSSVRLRQFRSYAVVGFVVLVFLFVLSHVFGGTNYSDRSVTGGPLVIVTVLDDALMSPKYIQWIKENRQDYAKRHGYINYFAHTSEYEYLLDDAPRSWATVPAVRHALWLYPRSTFFFHLSPHAFITNPSLSISSHILQKERLESLMIKDTPVVPPDSVIHTFSHLSGNDVDLVVAQDAENLLPGSYLVRNTEWAKFFLDSWFDPLYRNYRFAKAETHALDHIIQWHPTMLAKLALIPQRIMNAYNPKSPLPGPDGRYQEGDFLVRFAHCDADSSRNCSEEMEPYYNKWAKEVKAT